MMNHAVDRDWSAEVLLVIASAECEDDLNGRGSAFEPRLVLANEPVDDMPGRHKDAGSARRDAEGGTERRCFPAGSDTNDWKYDAVQPARFGNVENLVTRERKDFDRRARFVHVRHDAHGSCQVAVETTEIFRVLVAADHRRATASRP